MSAAQHTPGRCMHCGKPVTKYTKDGVPARSVSLNAADRDGLFCRMRCAMEYGIAAAHAAIAKAEGSAS